MSKGRRNFFISDFYCTKCGNKGIMLPRGCGSKRDSGHLKNLFCIHCQEGTNHVEIRGGSPYTYAHFLEEFRLGRFVDGNRVPIADLQSCGNVECEYNRNGKCWNASLKDCERKVLSKHDN